MAEPVEPMPSVPQTLAILPGRDDTLTSPSPKLNVKALIWCSSVGAVVFVAVLVTLLAIGGNHLGDDLRAWAYALPIVALLPAAYITVKRQQSLEAQHDLDARKEEQRKTEAQAQHDLDARKEQQRRAEVDDTVKRGAEAAFRARYSEAATLLGSEQAAVRLAGVTAMAGLADEWDPQRQQCIDVLCGYLRLPYNLADGLKTTVKRSDDEVSEIVYQQRIGDQQVRLTIISTITAHLKTGAPTSWQGHNFDFTGATFDGGQFDGAVFSGGRVSFVGAVFSGGRVSFVGAVFSGGEVSFVGAVFSGGRVSFGGAVFSGGRVDFVGARFSGGRVSFFSAVFSGGEVDFDSATFSGREVDFAGAVFSGGEVYFVGAVFSGGEVSFADAVFSGGNVTNDGKDFRGWPPTVS